LVALCGIFFLSGASALACQLQPVRAGGASLYSKEYFTLVRDRLNVDGIALQWCGGTDRSTGWSIKRWTPPS
jgi:hypothetical protein